MAKEPEKKASESDPANTVCGIIMPISAMAPDYDAAHWTDVRRVLDDAICAAGMVPQIVSDSFETDVIQRRIVHNLYVNPVVVCDVSGLNPNVMFELGMRLTFKKPVIVVTDDVGRIPFDTSVIEHIPYPRDLHIHKTTDFAEKLTDRIKALRQQVEENKFKPYLEAFGTFEVFQPSTESVPADKYIAERLDEMTRTVRRLERSIAASSLYPAQGALSSYGHSGQSRPVVFTFHGDLPPDTIAEISGLRGVLGVGASSRDGRTTLTVELEPLASTDMDRRILNILSRAPVSLQGITN